MPNYSKGNKHQGTPTYKMTADKFNSSLNNLLSDGRIHHVIEVLHKNISTNIATHPDLSSLATELEHTATTYNHLRNFLLEGKPDPDRLRIYESIKDQLRNIGREYLFIINEDRLDPLFSEYRMQKVRNQSLRHLIDEFRKNAFRISMASETEADPKTFIKKKERLVENIFLRVWTLPPHVEDEIKEAKKILTDPEMDFEIKSQIISGLMLGLLRFYDPMKFMVLLESYEEFTDERLAARALTAIVMVISRWEESVMTSPKIKGLLDSLEDSILTYARLKEVVKILIRTRDTDRVSREVNDAFKSTMREISPEMLEKLQKEGLAVDSAETGLNPEWEKLMKNKEIEEKMQSINDMQLEGMDVMMQTFARLKNFAFFRSVSNWFVPFSTDHSDIYPLFETFDKEGFMTMADATEMCSGDRFSFVLGIMQMPEEKRNLLAANVNSALEMMKEHVKDRENMRCRSVFAAETLSFARDIYRFAKLYPRHREFYDPFAEPVDFLQLPLLKSQLDDEQFILECANFYFEHGYYPNALALYQVLINEGKADRKLFEKIGYAYQTMSDFAGALENYEKADLFSSDADRSSTWLIKKLAFTNKALGNYMKAAEYYERLLELNPDDLNVEFHLGSVLLRAGEIESAKEILAKVHYLDPDHKMCNRIYTRLKGHEAFINGEMNEALVLYEAARGEQNTNQYRLDLAQELKLLSADADISALQILLDV